MKFRTAIIFSGHDFQVPERIQRIDTKNTHGWQVRYSQLDDQDTEMFSDGTNDGSGAAASLEKAKTALLKRIKRLPARTGLRKQPTARKSNDLPVGVSGPTERNSGKAGRSAYFSFQVSVPLPNGGSTTKSVYIGTANTATPEREAEALAKAIAIRDEAVRKVAQERTKAKRAAAVAALTSK